MARTLVNQHYTLSRHSSNTQQTREPIKLWMTHKLRTRALLKKQFHIFDSTLYSGRLSGFNITHTRTWTPVFHQCAHFWFKKKKKRGRTKLYRCTVFPEDPQMIYRWHSLTARFTQSIQSKDIQTALCHSKQEQLHTPYAHPAPPKPHLVTVLPHCNRWVCGEGGGTKKEKKEWRSVSCTTCTQVMPAKLL